MIFKFNTAKAISYANNYKDKSNPFYKVFDKKEEGCNFVSQCVFAGCESLSRQGCPNWFYESELSYSEAWVNNEAFIRYLLSHGECGPIGRIVKKALANVGDIVFSSEKSEKNIVGIITRLAEEEKIFVCKGELCGEFLLSEIDDEKLKFIHIIGVKK